MRFTDPITDFFNNIATVTAAGVTLPAEFTELRDRLEEFTIIETPCRDRLHDALLSGNGDLSTLRALTLAEQAQQPHALNTQARKWVVSELIAIYSAVAVDNYTAIAQEFNRLAADFSKATDAVDVEADAATLISAPDKQRKAYVEAELLAQRMTELIPALRAAAALAGAQDVETHQGTLTLVCDPSEATGQQTWSAWFATGRCGRWAALKAAGITLRAARLSEFAPYARTADDTGTSDEQPSAMTA